jgi:mono/diheme cytochrome c family protein/plastocyanin
LLVLTPLGAARAQARLVTVTATDTSFRLSAKVAPIGTVTFAVVNAGKKTHDFRIAGKKTPRLTPGKGAKLVVTFTRAGTYLFNSTVPGDASKGLRGAFSIQPAKTVAVTLTDSLIRLTTKKAPVGSVGFIVRNAGKKRHDFRIAGKKTPVLAPRATATLIVTFARAASYPYTSTLAGDAAKGLKGTFVVGGGTTTTTTPTTGGNTAAGKQVFLQTGCGSCHTLKAAGTSGTIGPNLDTAAVSRATVVSRVTNGKGVMPAYKGTLTPQQIDDVADFIVAARSG